MAEIVNLRMARKAKARAALEREAEANRARFGRTSGEKRRDSLEGERRETALRGALRETAPDDGGGSSPRD